MAIAGGIALIVVRKSAASSTAEAQRGMFGKAGEKTAPHMKPSGMAVAGVAGILLGIALIVAGIMVPAEGW